MDNVIVSFNDITEEKEFELAQDSYKWSWKSIHSPLDMMFSYMIYIIPVFSGGLWLMSLFTDMDYYWLYVCAGSLVALFISGVLKAYIFTPICDRYGSDLCDRPNGYNRYGMPSGHVMQAAYTALFMYFVVPRLFNAILAVMFISYMAYTRVIVFQMHTLSQTVLGLIFGGLQAYMSSNMYLLGVQ
jgi:membrane-associated phospholipid phosphatase